MDQKSPDVLEEAAHRINSFYTNCLFLVKDHALLEVPIKMGDILPTVRTILESENMEEAISAIENDESSKALLDSVPIPRIILLAVTCKVRTENGRGIRPAFILDDDEGRPPEETTAV